MKKQQTKKQMKKQQMQKMDGAGYVVRGTPWLGNVEDAIEEIGDRDFYRKTMR